MVYVTYIQPHSLVTEHRATIEELLFQAAGYTNNNQSYSKNFFKMRTFSVTHPRPADLSWLINKLNKNFTKEYIQFRIPKASGGTRLIEAPAEELKTLQKEITDILQNGYKILPHNAAYAYTRGRCAYDALVTHQRSKARWFLKIDIKDFFPSITAEVLKDKLPQIYPLNWLDESSLDKLIDIATNEHNVLPQGSPLSPLLSNLIMVGFDLALSSKLRRFEFQSYTYTRYADDMLISCPYTFEYNKIVEVIEELFTEFNLPFTISKHKLRYASSAGRNWNLGLMYNKDLKITVGTKRKKELHSLLNSFVVEYPWDIQPTQELIGKLGYLKNVEPDYYNTLINKYETKYNVNIASMFKEILNS
jgi:retron-type reverse transcriptase